MIMQRTAMTTPTARIATTTTITATLMLMTTNKPAKPRRRAAAPSVVARPVESAVDGVPDHSAAASAAIDAGWDAGLAADEGGALYRLMTWLSPAFPVGAFSYSSGIEWAVEAGDITDAATLQSWLSSMLADGPGFCDGVFLAHAHRAASSGDDAQLHEIAELASALAPSRERQLETSAQGRAFVQIVRAAWNCASLDRLTASCGGAIVYPVAVGVVSAAHAISL